MTIHLDINPDSEQVTVQISNGVTWTVALRALATVMHNLALKTAASAAEAAIEDFKKQHPNKKVSASQRRSITREAKGDIADQINFAVSNILTELSPKDPDLQLSETVILACENQLIEYAKDNNLTLAQVIKQVNETGKMPEMRS